MKSFQFLFLLLCLFVTTPAFGGDELEKIGQQKDSGLAGALENYSGLPDTILPWDAQAAQGFKTGDKIDTQEKLDAELKRMRERYAPFLAELAPAIPARPALELSRFDWRLATAEDAKDLTDVLEGKGEWKQVRIPHYWGPINKAASYYRTVVNLDDKLLQSDALFLHFQSVDYIADVYLNGRKVGAHEGLFDAFEFDIKPFAKAGDNVLVVQVRNEPIQMGDPFNTGPGRQFGMKFAACGGPGWDEPGKGWTMCPPGFGIWQRAWIEARPATFVRDIFVRPMPQKSRAEVWVELADPTEKESGKPITLTYSLYGQNFKAALAENQLAAAETSPLEPGVSLHKFTIQIPQNQLRWWSEDEPWLYQIQIQLTQNGHVIDTAKRQFGMRSFEQSITSTPKGRFYLNGEEIKLRGANMMGNLMQDVMRDNFDQLRDDILLAKIAHMNYWRMTQQPCQSEVYDYFDRLGLLAQTDMPTFNGIRKDQAQEGLRELEAMVRLVRGHACDAVITYLNEPDFHKPMMLDRQGHIDLFNHFDEVASLRNPDQVIKWVEGDYVGLSQGYSDSHNYGGWYGSLKATYLFAGGSDPAKGWMHGCGEFGAEALDSIALMNEYYPKSWLENTTDGHWTPSAIPRCQCVTVGKKWFGTLNTMEDWVRVSQDHQKWVVRLMTESMRRNPRMNSFAVHLLIDAWPAGWMKAIMDCDRQAKPAYFAYRDALTPLAVSLQPDAFYCFSGDPVRVRAWVCNDTVDVPAGAVLRYQLELNGKLIQTGNSAAAIEASAPEFQGNIKFTAPNVAKRQPLTVRLGLFDHDGKPLHETAMDLDLFPKTEKGQKLDQPGGQAQKLAGT